MNNNPMNPSMCILRERRTKFLTRDDADSPILQGYFIVFNQPYYDWFGDEEIVLPGAIDSRTDTSDVRALVDHVSHLVLGRRNDTTQTLDWSIDDTGLFATISVNTGDTDAVSLYSRAQRGDVDQASFGFDEDEVAYEDLPDGHVRRKIAHISKLWEISVCTFPAYEQTFVEARSARGEAIRARRLAAEKSNLKRRLKNHA